MSFVEEQAEVGENHPELLPAVAVLELPQEVTGQLVLQGHRGSAASDEKTFECVKHPRAPPHL